MEVHAVPNGQLSVMPPSPEKSSSSLKGESPIPNQGFNNGTPQLKPSCLVVEGQMEGLGGTSSPPTLSPESNESPAEDDHQCYGKRDREASIDEHPKDPKRSKIQDSGRTISNRLGIQMREEAEALHAESQRLLRETTGTSFAPEQVTKKPVSSLIEKIRQRKLELANKVSKISTSNIRGSLKVSPVDLKNVLSEGNRSDDSPEQKDEFESVMYKPPARPTQEPGEPGTPKNIPWDESTEKTSRAVNDLGNVGEDGSTRTSDSRCVRSTSNSECTSPPRSFLRAPLVESQDLYSDSQLSPFREQCPVAGHDENAPPVAGIRMNLHLDSETQDDDLSRWLEDDEKENRDPTGRSSPELIPTVAHVRALIDDEAEDEDDDPLEDEDDDDDEDASGELPDLLTQDAGEKAADVDRRSELHSKWLEQQDIAMEDNILHRIEGGWKQKGKEIPPFLKDKEKASFSGDDLRKPSAGNKRDAEFASADFLSSFKVLRDHMTDASRIRTVASSGGNTENEDCPMTQNDLLESSDDEEAEEKLRRQLFLEDSEERMEFLSVVDDESSREIFSLINKVNVTTVKPRTATVHSDLRTNVTGHHHPPSLQHQSSFLRRKVTTSVATTRQGSGNSRSYVFGRDDSNSRDASRSNDKNEQQSGKAKSFASLRGEQGVNSTTQRHASSAGKASLPKDVKPRGPSLFQVLKQQAADLANGSTLLDLGGNSSSGDDLSIFLAVKPSRQSRSSRGR